MKTFFKNFITVLLIGILLIALLFFYMIQSGILRPSLQSSNSKDMIEENSTGPEEPTEVIVTPVTLSFAGDVQFSEDYTKAFDANGISAIADETMLSYMQNADLFVLNNEFSFSLRGEPMEEKQYTFRTDPKYVKILQEIGTDVVSVANNHTIDFGQDAFVDTLDTLANAEIAYIGGGRNLSEALTPATYSINGQSFAIFAATRVLPSTDWYAKPDRPGMLPTYDPTELNRVISEAESKYDHIIVFVHWGVERVEIPEEYQRDLAKGYIDAGADLIIGAHPHVLQGFEYYKGVPICYSLGNYLFGNRTGETLLLNASFDSDDELSIQLIPCKRIDGILTKIQDSTQLFNHLTDISFGAVFSHGGTLIESK